MLITTPALNPERIADWIREAAEDAAPRAAEAAAVAAPVHAARQISFDFGKTRQALSRARTKAGVKTIKPLRRLRTNQAAVNEALMDAIGALIATNKEMAREIASLANEIAELRWQMALRDGDD